MATATRSRNPKPTTDDEDDAPIVTGATTYVDDDEEEEKPVKGKTRQIAADDDDDDEEEEEAPAPRKGRAAAAPAPRSAAIDDDDDDDDLDDDDDDTIIIGEEWEDAAIPTGDFPMVNRGTYVVMLSDTEVRKAGEKAKNPGAKYGVLVFKIRPEDNESKMGDDDSTVTIWHSLFFSAKSLGRSKKTASEMGVVVAAGENIMEPLRDLADDEARFEAVIGIERYRAEDDETGKMVNKKRNKILRILGPVDN